MFQNHVIYCPALFCFSDSSGYRLGVYDCSTGETYSRQLALDEVARDNIAVYEARALLFCVQNVRVHSNIRVLRLHCDNLICVTAFKDFQGCRNPEINVIIKELIEWQRKHRILIEIVYIPTAENYADAPSREIFQEEISVCDRFLR